nr:SemiSWEET family transporter [uncultured Kingella sp.]
MNEKQVKILSVVATITAVCMYVAYIPQIQANLAGSKGSPWQPLAAAVNCTLWVAYGLLKKPRDLPVAIANAPGVILGLVAFVTSL